MRKTPSRGGRHRGNHHPPLTRYGRLKKVWGNVIGYVRGKDKEPVIVQNEQEVKRQIAMRLNQIYMQEIEDIQRFVNIRKAAKS